MAIPITRMSAQEYRAWIALISTAELLPTALDAQLQHDSALTHYEFIVLGVLQRDGTMRLSELAAATNATLPRASKVISRMQQRDLVQRVTHPADRRAVDIRLTTEGRRALVHSMPGHLEKVRELVLSRLDAKQLDTLAEALEPVVDALDPNKKFGPR